MEKKTDRRVRKTKNQLRTGLARLMKKKNIGQITVKELVDDVDINRSTFYLHYSDIPSLLKEIEDDMIEEIERAILEHPIKIEKDTTYLFIEDLFRVLSDNREIGCALLGPYGDITFIRRIEKFLEENSRDLLAERFPEKFAEMKYFYSFCFNGCLGFIRTWLENGENMPPEYAARLKFLMVLSSLVAFYEDAKENK